MKRHLRRNLMIGVALAALLAGVVIAVIPRSTHHHSHPRREVGQHRPSGESQLAADYLGLSRSQLRRRLRAGQTLAQIAESIPGRSSSGLIDALLRERASGFKLKEPPDKKERARLARLRARIVIEVNAQRARRGDIPAAALRLGLSEAELRRRLQGGQTLAQIARAGGRVSPTGLIDTLVGIKAKRLETALHARSITEAQEKAARASLRARVTREVNRKLLQSG